MRTIARCGCSGQCSCRISGGNGIGVSGVGNPNNPYILDVDGGEIAGRGLGWDSTGQRLQVRTSGSGLGFDGSGALVNTGGGDGTGGGAGGGVGSWPTVDNLISRGSDVIGGLHGAGYMIKPAQMKHSYEYGLERGLDMLHIPVRFLSDGTPVVHMAEQTGAVNLSWSGPEEHVQEQDKQRWRILAQEPGMWNPRQAHQPDNTEDPLVASNWNQTGWHFNAPRHGWFGYLEPNEYGLLTLDELLRICAGWVVCVLNLRWPERDTPGGPFTHPTPEARTERFLSEVLRLLDKYRMVNSSVIASTEKTIPGGSTTGEVSVFERFYNRGVACGMWLHSADHASQHPPDAASWDPMATWVFPYLFVPQPETYSAFGLNMVSWPVNRQYQRNLVNTAGALGVLSGDPEYYAGAIESNLVHGGYRYRHNANTWDYDTVDHGTLPPADTVELNCRSSLRGYHIVGSQDLHMGAGFSHGLGDHYVLQGWMCPLEDPTNFTLDFWLGWDALPVASADLYTVLAFGVIMDYPFQDWQAGTVPAEDTGYSGYTFAHGSNGWSNLQAHDGTGPVSLDQPTQVADPNVGMHHYRLGVNPKGIRVTEWSGGTAPTLLKEHANVTTTLATAHRGGYVYIGRNTPNGGSNAVARFGNPIYIPGDGTNTGPL